MEGLNIVGVQFRRAGKIYDFCAQSVELRVGDQVVVDTERGSALAEVVKVKFALPDELKKDEIKPILRKASEADLKESAKLNSKQAEEFTRSKVKELKLDMRILKAEVQFGGSKVVIYFTAPGRVDFRELVKQLAGGLKARVELKQVGARDETKIIGGIGICGREYCCSSFLREFVPVSIKMAKNQNLALNPTKVSGGCGRLLCCLTYENDLYTELRKNIPARGTRVEMADGSLGKVLRGDLLNQVCEVEFDDGYRETVAINKLLIVDRQTPAPATQTQDKKPDGDEWGEDLDLDKLMDD